MGIVILCKSPTVLHGHSGSTAEEYAKSHGLEFVSLDAAIITQPVNTVVAKADDNASVKFTAKGDGLTYKTRVHPHLRNQALHTRLIPLR